MHAIEKILAKSSGKAHVATGEIIMAKVDFAEINDLYLQTVFSFKEMGGKKVWDREKAAFVFDHYSPCPSAKAAQNHYEMRQFRDENKLKYHFDVNSGVCHQVMVEAGLIYPGMVVVATDSHTTTHGAFGAFGTGCGATDMACILKTGQMWLRIPEIINIELHGQPCNGVYAKDVILYIISQLRADGAIYKCIDFTGEYIDMLGVSERMTICNMAVEMGAKTAYMQPNRAVIDYVNARSDFKYDIQITDPGYNYIENYSFDVSRIYPQLSCPDSVDNVFPVESITKADRIHVDQCYIGSCTNGRVEDFEIAAKILEGKKIDSGVRLLIVPASKEVLQECIAKGYIQELLSAGATLVTPGCAACLGTHEGILSKNEVCISSTNRNFPGRMGSNKAQIYLSSPATVAASALKGYITDPRSFV